MILRKATGWELKPRLRLEGERNIIWEKVLSSNNNKRYSEVWMQLRKICGELVEVEVIFSTWLDKTHFSRHQLYSLNRKHKPAASHVLFLNPTNNSRLNWGGETTLHCHFPVPRRAPLLRLRRAIAGEHGSCCAMEEDLLSQSKQ